MSVFLLQEQECRHDMLRLLHKLLNMLEEHIDTLHKEQDETNMKPAECEQALDRHITLMLRLLQIRQQFAHAESKASEQYVLDIMLHKEADPGVV